MIGGLPAFKGKKLRIAMAGGGTGGHVFPIKSLLQWIYKKPQYMERIKSIYWFGAKESLEERVCGELKVESGKLRVESGELKVENYLSSKEGKLEINFIPILSGKYRRETLWKSRYKNVRDIFLFAAGFFQSFFRLVRHRIDVVFCKGGYVALPVVLAAAVLHRKIIVHESDTHAGLVNKIASRFAKQVFTGFDNVIAHSKTIGQILSNEILVTQIPEIKNPHKTQVLVVGGSQGSKKLYQAFFNVLESHAALQSEFEFYIVLGLLNHDMSTQLDRLPNVHTYGFITQKQMGELYAICDVTITRGGTTSLAEQKLYNMKQIIVPIPWTHDQYDNAQRYVDHYKDIMINQRDIAFEKKLMSALIKLRNFKKKEHKKDKQAQISRAKEIIVKSLLGL